jgi:hypothetical protein
MRYNIGEEKSINFSIESVRKRYTDKNVFVSDMLAAHDGMFEEKDLKKALDKVWKEAFPNEAKAKKEKEEPSGES